MILEKSFFHAEDVVTVVGDNAGRPGGGIHNDVFEKEIKGKQFTLSSFCEILTHYGNKNAFGEEIDGYWSLKGSEWVFHPSQLRLVKRATVRDERGRYKKRPPVPKEAWVRNNHPVNQEIKKKEEVKKKEIIFDEAYMKKCKGLYEELAKMNVGGICSFAYISKGDKHFNANGACHYRLHAIKITHCVLNLKRHWSRFSDDAKALYEDYLFWFMNESPFAPYIVSKDVKKVLEEGMVMNVNATKSQVVTTAIAIRSLSEHANVMPTLQFLEQYPEMDKLLKLVIAQFCSPDGDRGLHVAAYPGGHHFLSSYKFSVDDYRRLKENGVKPINSTPMFECKGIFQIFNAVGEDKGVQFRSALEKCSKQVETGEGWNKVVHFYLDIDKFIKKIA